jgi:hypothetical protein
VDSYLTDRVVARALLKHPRTIQRWCKDGKLPGATKAGRSWRIPMRALREAQLDEALVTDEVERVIRAATHISADLRKEWIDLMAQREGLEVSSERSWTQIASEIVQLQLAMRGLPLRPSEIPGELT